MEKAVAPGVDPDVTDPTPIGVEKHEIAGLETLDFDLLAGLKLSVGQSRNLMSA